MEADVGALVPEPGPRAVRNRPEERQADAGRLVITCPDRAFAGADPYRRAAARGVKLIGATAHYVTAELDAGPIIEQDTVRVDHRSSADDLRRLGRHVERAVLARAVGWHLEDRVIVHQNRTIVFS